jgi:hypothetical protein
VQITKEDIEKYGHKDEWGVDCLYIHEAQRMLAYKLREAAETLVADAVAFERRVGIVTA